MTPFIDPLINKFYIFWSLLASAPQMLKTGDTWPLIVVYGSKFSIPSSSLMLLNLLTSQTFIEQSSLAVTSELNDGTKWIPLTVSRCDLSVHLL